MTTFAKTNQEVSINQDKQEESFPVLDKYSEKDLAEFKSLIEKKIEKAEKTKETYESLKESNGNGTYDTSPTFKAFEDGSGVHSNESNAQTIMNLKKFIRDLKNALIRIENKTYGICRITGKLINKERLKLVPHATLSIEAKNKRQSKN